MVTYNPFKKLSANKRKVLGEVMSKSDVLFEQAKENGMTTLREAGIGKVESGETTISEILRSTVQDN